MEDHYLLLNGKRIAKVINGKVYNLDGAPAQTIKTSQKSEGNHDDPEPQG